MKIIEANNSETLIGNKTYRNVIIIFVLICICISISCFMYYRQLQNTVTNESSDYLQEISKQIGSNASRTINDNFSILATISTVLESTNATTFDQLRPIVLEQQKDWNYKSIMLVDQDGVAYDAFGNITTLSNDEYLRDSIVGRNRSMSAAQVVGGEECIVFMLPLENIVINGIHMSALAASYDLSTFDQILSMTAFGGKGYSYIIRRDGSVVVRSSSKYAQNSGFNVLNALSDVIKNFQQVKDDIKAGNSGMVDYVMNEEHVYMTYTPLLASEWCLVTFVPVAVVNAKSQMLLRITLLLCSVITLAFAILFASLIYSTYRHKRKLEHLAYVDTITQGNTIQRFYELAESLLNASHKPQYTLIYANVEKFKFFNEQFGRNVCDDMLKSIYAGIAADLSNQECIGRLFADNFCILVKYVNEATLRARLNTWYENASKYQEELNTVWLSPIIEFGVYVISNDTLPFPNMIDRAKMALREANHELHGKIRCAIYDDEVRRRMFREKQLEDMMENSLQNEEFLVYLQPKYHTQSEKIGGAEALVRWKSQSEGMIYPDEFIQLFEQNGFIVQLDFWVFEKVCQTMRKWMDTGITPFKISVNCSRMHLNNSGFLDRYLEICNKYNLPPNYLEIELTENVVFENVELLSKTIDKIHEMGFGCSMDDFGSGYSSLNMIQDIPVDTLKLDKIFFHKNSKDISRTESVVRSILDMSKALKMTTVAEGIEERMQVDMLKRLGCDYIQGYYFAKPMPIEEFETLAFGNTITKV